MPTHASDWIERFGSALGVPAPTADEIEELLALAGVAAHASERIAAPISCWLVARSGHSVVAASELATALAAEIETEGGQ
jgi:hypothetical protein